MLRNEGCLSTRYDSHLKQEVAVGGAEGSTGISEELVCVKIGILFCVLVGHTWADQK